MHSIRFNYPSLCFDNFYNNPDRVRDYALSLEGWTNIYGAHPGLRTAMLIEYDEGFYRKSVDKFMALFDDWMPAGASFDCSTYFQKVYRFSSDPNDVVNNGWIHVDGEVDIAGVIYLDPDPILDNGTSFYRPNGISCYQQNSDNFIFNDVLKENPLQYQRVLGSPKSPVVDKNICKVDDIEWYRENLIKNNEQFELTMEVKNCYNRCIAYSGQQLHTVTNFWSPNEDDFRLAQVFFVYDLRLPANFITSCRIHDYDI